MQSARAITQKIANTTMDSKPQVIKEYICEGCGNKIQVIKTKLLFGPNKGKWHEGKIGCDCEFWRVFNEEREAARVVRMKRIFEENSLINPALRKASFDNFEAGEFGRALAISRKYVNEFDIKNPRNLLFQGTFGTGKSHLSVSIAKALTEKGFTTVFVSTPKLLTKIRNTYNKSSETSEEQIINALVSCDLVVFDDIGAEGDVSGWAMQKIFEVIDQRAGKHNVYTTNLSSSEFEATKDLQRIFSRMMMNASPVIMNGTDYRKRQFLKGAADNV